MRRVRVFAFATLVPLALAGCGGPETATVEGRVQFRRPPAVGDLLAVSLVGPSGQPVTVAVDPDGAYRATGVEPGEVRVGLTCTPADQLAAEEAADPAATKAAPGRSPKRVRRTPSARTAPAGNPVPPAYWDPRTSRLALTAKPGENRFDIDVPN